MQAHVIVLDPGHGGDTAAGGSSPNRSRGTNGLLEKDVALDIAQRVKAQLAGQADVRLTRQGDRNLPLSERAAVAYNAAADAFVSLHWNSSPDLRRNAVEGWIARDAAAGSRALAAELIRRVAEATEQEAGSVYSRDLGVLLPARHRTDTRTCLIELGYLTHPAQALRLEQSAYRDKVAQAIAAALLERLRGGTMLEAAMDEGDGAPAALRKRAVDQCWTRCEELRKSAAQPANASQKSASKLLRETGVRVDANPYLGISPDELEAVIRAAFTAHQPPEVLLALWVKEGSSRSVASPLAIPQATTQAHARTLFRCKVYYEDLGIDHFIVTTRAGTGSDNVYDSRDTAADAHQRHFVDRVEALVREKLLQENIAGAIDRELTVTGAPGKGFAVQPSVRFYALSLLLADALFTRFMRTATAQLGSEVPVALNYMHWNMGTESFKRFLASADAHRKEPAYVIDGSPIDIETWALHRTPHAKEFQQARANAIRFLHYMNAYRAIFAPAMNLITPGIEDLRASPPGTQVAEILQGAIGPRMHHWVLLSNPYRTPEENVRQAFQAVGLTAAQATALPAAGLAPLVRLMGVLSDAALEDLLRFVNYSPAQLKNPPLKLKNADTQAMVLQRMPARLLIALPGHAREVARSVATAEHAYFIENLGWLMMHAVRDELTRQGEPRWWIPPLPLFASRFRMGAPGAPDWVRDLANRFHLIDPALGAKEFAVKCDTWRNGLPGQQWGLETGHPPTNQPLGQAFYPSLIAARLPLVINNAAVTANKAAIDAAWQQRITQVDKAFPPHLSNAAVAALRTIVDNPAVYGQAGLQAQASLGTMRVLAGDYPKVEPAGRNIGRSSANVLGGLPPAFEAVFSTLEALGWNDLLFHTSGTMVFRGVRNNQAASAYTISKHAYGAAIDIQAFENPPGEHNHTIHARLAGVFKAFGFRWGEEFQPPTQPDPHHFEFP